MTGVPNIRNGYTDVYLLLEIAYKKPNSQIAKKLRTPQVNIYEYFDKRNP